ncbi:helix-turn-helix domain-containing protein [Dyadobacter sandarakinus]|uniref:Helix-turn-helix domain-containing protein n=1 Tax=Dyadobacter sandarakinus TaxID=2747268 RepID=A0ABX7ID69_9BACT|nr:helix-turn-helix domain-containing protein [Dyadobacter sandarakinus]
MPRIDIPDVGPAGREDVVVSRFAPYLHEHQNLALPHRHSFYHLLFFTRGAGFHTIDFRHFPVNVHQVYFMSPGQVHSWNFEGEVDGFVVNFSESFFSSFLLRPDYIRSFSFFSGAEKSVLNLDAGLAAQIIPVFEVLLQTFSSQAILRDDLLRAQLLQLLITIEQTHVQAGQPGAHAGNQLIAQYRRLIEDHFHRLKRPGDYAGLLHVTPNHLNAVCKEHLGVQAGALIRDRIALEAKRLLVNLDLSISEIAYKLDFEDNSYFSKFFKKHTGLSPEMFRLEYAAVK